MSKIIVEKWEFKADKNSDNIIIPDGCRDVLLWKKGWQPAQFSITSLDDTSYFVPVKAGDYLQGFRLAAGTIINEKQLLASLKNTAIKQEDIIDRIDNFSYLDENVKQALDCLALGANSVSQAAKDLGVSTKTLQRKICKNTSRNPAAWLSLARVRRAARIVANSNNLTQTALSCGYSDQSHMNREFKRWLNISPAKIYKYADILRQLNSPAYH